MAYPFDNDAVAEVYTTWGQDQPYQGWDSQPIYSAGNGAWADVNVTPDYVPPYAGMEQDYTPEQFSPEQYAAPQAISYLGNPQVRPSMYGTPSQETFDALGQSLARSQGTNFSPEFAKYAYENPERAAQFMQNANAQQFTPPRGFQGGGFQMPQVRPPDYRDIQGHDDQVSAANKMQYNRAEQQRYEMELEMAKPFVQAQVKNWLNSQELSHKESLRLQKMQAAVGDVMASPEWTDEEKAALVTQLKTGIDPLAMRQKMTQAKQMAEQRELAKQEAAIQNEMLMRQNAMQQNMMQMDASQWQKHYQQHTVRRADGSEVYMDPQGKPHVLPATKSENIFLDPKYKADWMYKWIRDNEVTKGEGPNATVEAPSPEEAAQAFAAFHQNVRPNTQNTPQANPQHGPAMSFFPGQSPQAIGEEPMQSPPATTPQMPNAQRKGAFAANMRMKVAQERAEFAKLKGAEFNHDKAINSAKKIVMMTYPQLQEGTPEFAEQVQGEYVQLREAFNQSRQTQQQPQASPDMRARALEILRARGVKVDG